MPHGRKLLSTVLGLFVVACASNATYPISDGVLALGTWGGDNAGVIVTDSAAHVHVGCTFGDMPGHIRLDADGRFAIDGSYMLRAYPIQVGPSVPARFSGRVVGGTLTLSVAVNDTVTKTTVALGPITVEYGHQPQMGQADFDECITHGGRIEPLQKGGGLRGQLTGWRGCEVHLFPSHSA